MNYTEVVLFLTHPVLFPFHPLQLIPVELAFEVVVESHQAVGFLLELFNFA